MSKKTLFAAGCIVLMAAVLFFLFQKADINSKRTSGFRGENRAETRLFSANARAEGREKKSAAPTTPLPHNKENTFQVSATTNSDKTDDLKDDVADETITLTDVHAETLIFLVRSYRKEFRKYPPTENAAFMLAMMGRNPSGKKFLEWPKTALSPAGEFLDPWGQPYRIQIDEATSKIEVRSAGPDREFGDDDDKVQTSSR